MAPRKVGDPVHVCSMLNPNEDSKAQAQRMATRIRNRLKETVNKHGFSMHGDWTYAAGVVKMPNGERRLVVTANDRRQTRHHEVKEIVSKASYVAPKKNPGGETGDHAEQRLMKWAKENGASIEAIAPTRPCCKGCTRAIQRRTDKKLDVVEPPSGVPKSKVSLRS